MKEDVIGQPSTHQTKKAPSRADDFTRPTMLKQIISIDLFFLLGYQFDQKV